MPLTVSDILHNADLFRSAYPCWPHPEPEEAPVTPDPVPLTYRGMSRTGRSQTGVVAGETPAALAERLFGNGYRWLSIKRAGVEVGGITVDRERGRVWWGEEATS